MTDRTPAKHLSGPPNRSMRSRFDSKVFRLKGRSESRAMEKRLPQPPPDVLSQRAGDSLILLNLKTDRIFELNSTAASLWELLEAGVSCEEAAAELSRHFSVSEEEVSAEIVGVTAQFRSEGLIAGG